MKKKLPKWFWIVFGFIPMFVAFGFLALALLYVLFCWSDIDWLVSIQSVFGLWVGLPNDYVVYLIAYCCGLAVILVAFVIEVLFFGVCKFKDLLHNKKAPR